MKRLALLFALGLLGAVIGAAQVVEGSSVRPTDEEAKSSEAPAYDLGDVPAPVSPGTVTFGPDEARAFVDRWSRESSQLAGVDYTPALDQPIKAHARTKLGGTVWYVTTYRNVNGQFCFGARLPGGQSITCSDREALFRDGPISVWPGRRQADDPKQWNVFWIEGLTQPPVAGVEVVSTDCSRERVRLDADGVFLHLTGPRKIYDGVWPYRIIARGDGEEIVAQHRISLHAPPTDAARAAGVAAPRPHACS